MMKNALHILAALAVILTMNLTAATAADAACYADYKAKRNNPLRLQYGVIKLPDAACTKAAARPIIQKRIGTDGWKLLNILSIFGPEQLEEKRTQAGKFFLKY